MSQDEAAERAGLAGRNWQRIEAEGFNITSRTIGKIARALDLDPLLLFRE